MQAIKYISLIVVTLARKEFEVPNVVGFPPVYPDFNDTKLKIVSIRESEETSKTLMTDAPYDEDPEINTKLIYTWKTKYATFSDESYFEWLEATLTLQDLNTHKFVDETNSIRMSVGWRNP